MFTKPQRPITPQSFVMSTIVVGVAAIPLAPQFDLTSLITSFVISVPSAAANSVFIGDGGVTITTGIEIQAGGLPFFQIQQMRQIYELQAPLLNEEHRDTCQEPSPFVIPFIVWNLNDVYVVAAANTTITTMFFKEPYV